MATNQAIMDMLAEGKNLSETARDPFIGDGRHTLALSSIELHKNRKQKQVCSAKFLVLESPLHKPGTFVTRYFDLPREAGFADAPTEKDYFKTFMITAVDLPAIDPATNEPTTSTKINEAISEVLEDKGQSLMGTVFTATGKKAKNSDFVTVTFTLDSGVGAERKAVEKALLLKGGGTPVATKGGRFLKQAGIGQ